MSRACIRNFVDILGTKYCIIVKPYDENSTFSTSDAIGYCNTITKKIFLCDLDTHPLFEGEGKKYNLGLINVTLRHEIVHAFLYESGLFCNAMRTDGPWPECEEIVDWIALQGEKIYVAWKAAGAV